MSFPPSLTKLFNNNAPYKDFVTLFKRSPDFIHSQGTLRETPLHLASIHNRADVLAFLLAQAVDKDCAEIDGETPLIIAAYKGFINVVNALLGAHADKDKARDDGATPLYIAAQQGNIKVVHALLEAGADKDKTTDSGATPLYIATQQDHIQVVDALLHAGADKDKAKDSGATPLYIATQLDHIQVVDALLHAGADKDKATDSGATPLYIAAQQGNIKVVHALLEAHADKDKARNDGATPLYIAAQHGNIKVVHALLEAHADKDKAMNDGATPLLVAAQHGHIDVVNALLEGGANIHLRWKTKNCTPLLAAALSNNKECFELLLEHPKVTTRMLADSIIDMDVSDAFRMQATIELEKRLALASEETMRAWHTCPITQTVIFDPVFSTIDGKCYEKSAITKWLSEHQTSPMNRNPMTLKNLFNPLDFSQWIEETCKKLDDAFFASRTTPMDLSSDTRMNRKELANHRTNFFDNKNRKRKHGDDDETHQKMANNEYMRPRQD